MPEDRPYTAKHAKDLAGLSYRQLNDWEARGAIPGARDDERTWRKFSPQEFFALMVCGEIRQRYGIPVERMRFVHQSMIKADYLLKAIDRMRLGLYVFILTDFERNLVIDSDLEITDLLRHAFLRTDETRPYIIMQLNNVVNRFLGSLKEPFELKADVFGEGYERHEHLADAWRVRNGAEFDLLQAIRAGDCDQISITLKDGEIRQIIEEADVSADDLQEHSDGVNFNSAADFETVTISKVAGKVARARRKTPTKYESVGNGVVLRADDDLVASLAAKRRPTRRGTR